MELMPGAFGLSKCGMRSSGCTGWIRGGSDDGNHDVTYKPGEGPSPRQDGSNWYGIRCGLAEQRTVATIYLAPAGPGGGCHRAGRPPFDRGSPSARGRVAELLA